ncbi:MarR family winged helix-turn-helix transcriptional regulator [Nocardia sp. NPDC003482]
MNEVRPPRPTPRERALWHSFFPMEAELWQWLGRRLRADAELSEADWRVLDALGNTAGHRLRAHELAARIAFGKSRLHQHVTRMVGRGLLHREPAPDDGRGTVVSLTPEGLTRFRRAQHHRARHIREALLDPLTPDEVDTLVRLAEKVRAHLRQLGT